MNIAFKAGFFAILSSRILSKKNLQIVFCSLVPVYCILLGLKRAQLAVLFRSGRDQQSR